MVFRKQCQHFKIADVDLEIVTACNFRLAPAISMTLNI